MIQITFERFEFDPQKFSTSISFLWFVLLVVYSLVFLLQPPSLLKEKTGGKIKRKIDFGVGGRRQS